MDNLQVVQNLRNEIKQLKADKMRLIIDKAKMNIEIKSLKADRLELAEGLYDSVFSDDPKLFTVMLKAEKIIEESK